MRYIGYKVLLDVWTQRKVVLLERVSLQEKPSYIILKRGKESTFNYEEIRIHAKWFECGILQANT